MNDELRSLQKVFPLLTDSNCRITSARSSVYNCIAWALQHDDRWLEPAATPDFSEDLFEADYPLDVLIRTFENRLYAVCDSESLEIGFDKVALFGREGQWTHAARQLRNGLWTSKLGKSFDIEHELHALASGAYGKVQVIMKRPI